MTELLLTRHNPLVDPSLHVWAWQIPIYLFLGGLVAGLMILAGLALLDDRPALGQFTSPAGLVLLSLGMLALFLDLEHKAYTWRLYTTFQITSPMSWGAWILLLVYPVLLALACTSPGSLARQLLPALDTIGRYLDTPGAAGRRGLAILSIAVGTGLGIYTGVLLSSLGARPLWNSAVLGPLFLASGLSSAAALGHMAIGDHAESERLLRVDTMALGAELVLLALFLIGLASSTAMHREAAGLLLGGSFSAAFWVLVVGFGLLLPLALQLLMAAGRIPHSPVPAVLVLLGGVALRFVFVAAGQHSHWATLIATTVPSVL